MLLSSQNAFILLLPTQVEEKKSLKNILHYFYYLSNYYSII